MKKSEKDSSTTRRLQDLQIKRVKTALFFSGAVTLALIIMGFCYIQDSTYSGLTNPFLIWQEVSRDVRFPTDNFFELPKVSYIISMGHKAPKVVDATVYFYVVIV